MKPFPDPASTSPGAFWSGPTASIILVIDLLIALAVVAGVVAMAAVL